MDACHRCHVISMLQQHRKMQTVEDGIVFQDFLGIEQCAMLWPLGLPTMEMVFAAPASILLRQCLTLVGPTFGTNFRLAYQHERSC
ncbi:hypothetical protein PILCRDRAFT_246994 [Piloderma croceum F 1598]|uniref:Uncharacterized protein n=1 Tax=Piloderma croceum (strain F 1598) TaxID=765440 RepID=A0A0C3BNR1_PILCF|nr:hypothetical protein PILCRDRAFT_246994 [Piloderma croceum F 1598]